MVRRIIRRNRSPTQHVGDQRHQDRQHSEGAQTSRRSPSVSTLVSVRWSVGVCVGRHELSRCSSHTYMSRRDDSLPGQALQLEWCILQGMGAGRILSWQLFTGLRSDSVDSACPCIHVFPCPCISGLMQISRCRIAQSPDRNRRSNLPAPPVRSRLARNAGESRGVFLPVWR